MRGNFIPCNTWNSTRVNNTEVLLPNLSPKEYSLVKSENKNLDFSYEKFSFSNELTETLKAFTNLSLDFVSTKENSLNKIVSLELNEENNQLVDIIKIKAEENSTLNLALDYFSKEDVKGFRHTIIEVEAEENSNVKIFISQRFSLDILSIQSVYYKVKKNANVEFIQVDLGSKENYLSYIGELAEKEANVSINSIYFGKNNQKLDFNYVANQIGQATNYDLSIKGALADRAQKTCRATIDFKRGSSTSKGSEQEYVTLLSDDIRNVAVPILLCTEDDVEGLHAASAGKIDEDILFYIMSRGFSETEAKRLILESKFAETIDLIDNEEIRKRVYTTLSKKLSEV
ncbi:SufD family Fe-S cluster assembly protein [Parvimonas micra]|uniref:SufB/SufD family protein n=1 Tax=Parvimonas micra TaxID=33033 RepID=UPI001E5E83FB|nr:SufD family Fe-S cluster assembly protein [Parvimonas micra]MCE3020317.1 SufD family Fe-S cluster assembly protein [Parvimonas micra]